MSSSWRVVWKCILDTFLSIYEAMNTIVIFDYWGSGYVSLWDLCVGVIVMGAIINLFINFTAPTLPDRWQSGVLGRFNENRESTMVSYWKDRLKKK